MPDFKSPPSHTLLEVLCDRSGLAEVADKVHGIVFEDKPITPEMATELETALGIPKCFWTNRDINYRRK